GSTMASLLSVLALGGCEIEQRVDRDLTTEPAGAKEIVEVPGVARLPVFSSAVRSGDLVLLSGAIGAAPGATLQLVEGGVGPERRRALETLRGVVRAAGGTLADMVRCTVVLADMADYAAMNEVYLEFFPSEPPARSALAASGLAFDAR